MGGEGAAAGALRVQSPPAGRAPRTTAARAAGEGEFAALLGRTIGGAAAGHERSASQEAKEVDLRTSTTDSTGQLSSAVNSDANSSDEEPHAQYHPLCVSLSDCLPNAPGAPASDNEASEDPVSTVMIRQIPRRYTQLKFLAKLSCNGFHGLVDFIYFPFDVKKGMHVGYGFINFIGPRHAARFQQEFSTVYLDLEMRDKGRPLRTHGAAVQGFENNFSHFVDKKTSKKADPRYSPLFMPQGSWASLSADVQVELMTFREAFTSRPPGQLEAAQGEAWGRDLRAKGLEEGGGLEEHTLSAPAPWDRLPAKIRPLGQLRPPPGLQPPRRCAACGDIKVTPDSMCPRCWPLAPQEPSPPKLWAPAPRRPPPLEGTCWPTAEPGPPWNQRSSLGHAYPAAPSVPTAPLEGFIGTYQQLEERRQELLHELAAVRDEQRRAVVSAAGVRPPLPFATFQLDSHS